MRLLGGGDHIHHGSEQRWRWPSGRLEAPESTERFITSGILRSCGKRGCMHPRRPELGGPAERKTGREGYLPAIRLYVQQPESRWEHMLDGRSCRQLFL